MYSVLGECAIDECEEPAKAQVISDQEILDDDDKVTDYQTLLIQMCPTHAIEELNG